MQEIEKGGSTYIHKLAVKFNQKQETDGYIKVLKKSLKEIEQRKKQFSLANEIQAQLTNLDLTMKIPWNEIPDFDPQPEIPEGKKTVDMLYESEDGDDENSRGFDGINPSAEKE